MTYVRVKVKLKQKQLNEGFWHMTLKGTILAASNQYVIFHLGWPEFKLADLDAYLNLNEIEKIKIDLNG